eukprot:CAMPEP_0178967538 /NCGR_PEP_ID=MMETSP0789-20121207/17661_1 /TAXON_ID=3005 /ORGANISM="Rhizosolenia setigera, Strain CCMP 1694" /LENGTH=664 /DNA_ID=CAMNT_0020653181 /DNA_START=93 /DNA_END=2087 /DNA_ORIENTATION=+
MTAKVEDTSRPPSENDDDEKQKKKKQTMKRKKVKKMLKDELKKESLNMLIGCVCLIGSTASNAAIPRAFSKLIDQTTSDKKSVSNTKDKNMMVPLSLIVIGGGISSFLRTTSLKRAENNIICRLRKQIFRSILLNQPISFFDGVQENEGTNAEDEESQHTPQLTTILNQDVEIVAKTVTLKIAQFLRSLSSTTYSAISMIQMNPNLFALSASIIPLLGISAVSLSKFTRKQKQKSLALEDQSQELALEKIQHIKMVKTCNRALDEIEKFDTIQNSIREKTLAVSLAEGFMMGGMFGGTAFALLMVVNAGGKAVARGKMTQGSLMGFATYSFLLGLGTSGMMKSMGEIKMGLTSATRIYDLIQSKGEEENNAPSEESIKEDIEDKYVCDQIVFNKVSFAYDSSKNGEVLSDISFTIKPGQIIALVGENGAGKSSIASLLSGLYKPSKGSIDLSLSTIEEEEEKSSTKTVSLTNVSTKSQMRFISIAPQNPVIFNTTIKENLCYAKPNATDDEIQVALKESNSESFISKLGSNAADDDIGRGLNYIPGKDGCRLSGGQRQRISLARSFLQNPEMLMILDEPTSSLDAEGDSAILDTVKAFSNNDDKSENVNKKKSLLIITHRKETLKYANQILVLKNGHLVESGSLDDLLAKGDEGELSKLMPDLI